MLLNLTEFSTKTLMEQIRDQILAKFLNDQIVAGEELEPVGIFARKQRISKNTIKRVYDELQKMGLVDYLEESGYFVKSYSASDKNKLKLKISSELNPDSPLNGDHLMIEEELKLARKIQSDLLPKKFLLDKFISIFGFTRPSRVVCGDFYDYFKVDDNTYGIVIADASGKGMPAAILISQIQAILKSEIDNGSTIKKTILKLNKHLTENSSARNFTSIFYGMIDISSNSLEFINAGHNFPVLINRDGSFQLVKTTGPALGLVKNYNYSTCTINLFEDATLFMYTDGITETMNEHGELFGEGRLLELIIKNRSSVGDVIIKQIIEETEKYKSSDSISDDKTILIAQLSDLTNQIKPE